MNKNYNSAQLKNYISKSKYNLTLQNLNVEFFISEYEKGELVTSPFQEEQLFQIIVSGSISIYFIRDDGSRYSLSTGSKDYILGDMEVFCPQNNSICTEAAEKLICISFVIESNKEIISENNAFLQLIANSLCKKMQAITKIDVEPSSLKERVLFYMNYKCKDGAFKGLERVAFQLNCSPRQLQRIMNYYEETGIVQKIGKGSYKLKNGT